jgi:uncharacterized protein (TIGR04255 family)
MQTRKQQKDRSLKSKMSRQYKKPPIEEAICEFHFSAQSQWDLAVPGLVYEHLRETFPKRTTGGRGWQIVIQADGGLTQRPGPDMLKFESLGGTTFAQVGMHFLSVHHIRPYSSWETFFPLIRAGFDAYVKEAKPIEISRINLRYINLIEIPEDPVDLEEYLAFYPHLEAELPQPWTSFITGIEFPYGEGGDKLRMNITSVPNVPGICKARLELDYFRSKFPDLSTKSIARWVNEAHDRVEETFEACITEKLRKVFDGRKARRR